jgi:predicted membrane-bound mannosyltransferase
VLESRFRRADVAAIAKTAASEGLFMGALDTGTRRILQAKSVCLLLLSGLLQYLVIFAGL